MKEIMKTWGRLALTVMLVLGAMSPAIAQTKNAAYWRCDVNGDGSVDVADIATIISAMAGDYPDDLQLSSTTLNLMTGYGGTVRIQTGSGSYQAVSSNEQIVTATVVQMKDGAYAVQISALKAGLATVSVSDVKTKMTETIQVTVTDEAQQIEGNYVDLGLPSGTLWATCNVGADEPEGFGWYVAWGETAEKEYYSFDNYSYSFEGDMLPDTRDVASVTLGGHWRMPTMEEQEELLLCTWSWEEQNSVQGARVTGPNGNSIFLPAASFKYSPASSNYPPEIGTYGSYWGRNTNGVYGAELVFGTADYKSWNISDFYWSMGPKGIRVHGRSVRPVYDESYTAIAPLRLSSLSITLMTGFGGTVRITTGNGSYQVVSSDDEVATASIAQLKDGSFAVQITALKAGLATVAVTDLIANMTETIQVTVDDEPQQINGKYVDLGLPSGTLWATCNVGADTPEGYGMYVSWGETKEKDYYSWSNYWLFEAGNTTDLNDAQDLACVTLGEGWRMPTMEEQEELLTCTWSWEEYNGVQGARVTGPNGNSIFLPAASFKDDEGAPVSGTYGSYWGRTHGNTMEWGGRGMVPCGSELVFGTADYKNDFSLSDFYCEMGPTGWCMCGRSIRPVYDKTYKPVIPEKDENDYTSYIVNPTYDGNDWSGWDGTPLSGYNPDNNAEHFNINFDTYQTISGLPKGTYRVGVQGFYRKGSYTNDYDLWVAGDTDNNNALLYATSSAASVSVPFVQPSSVALPASLGGNAAEVGNGLYIPDDMVAAGCWFAAGYYHNYLDVAVGDDGVLTIGIRKETTIDRDWTIIDNWTLYRTGE